MLKCFVFQRIRATVNSQEQKRLLMDLDISMRTVDCPFTVTFYGALFREVWHPGDQPHCPWENPSKCQGFNLHLDVETWYNVDLLDPSLRICHVQLLLGERGGMRSHARRIQGQPSPSARNVRGPCAQSLGLGGGFE